MKKMILAAVALIALPIAGANALDLTITGKKSNNQTTSSSIGSTGLQTQIGSGAALIGTASTSMTQTVKNTGSAAATSTGTGTSAAHAGQVTSQGNSSSSALGLAGAGNSTVVEGVSETGAAASSKVKVKSVGVKFNLF